MMDHQRRSSPVMLDNFEKIHTKPLSQFEQEAPEILMQLRYEALHEFASLQKLSAEARLAGFTTDSLFTCKGSSEIIPRA